MFIYAIMQRLKEEKGEASAAELWKASGQTLSSFACSLPPMSDEELAKDAEKHGLAFMVTA